MTGEIGAAGDLAMGTMLARAVEPHGNARGDGTGGICLNCGTRRHGAFCHACGQSSHVHRSFGAIGHDLAHGVFHFEGRIWRTLPMLLFRPGELTRRYVHGERARFVSPMALFLFIIFVLFAMLSVVGAHLELPEVGSPREKAARAEIRAALADNEALQARLRQQRRVATDPAVTARLDGKIAVARKDARMLEMTRDQLGGLNLEGLAEVKTGWKRLDKGIGKAAENPNLILYKLQSNAYKFAWVLIPFSVPFLWLLFPFSRRFTLYDHAVFVTYSLCFVSLLGIVLGLLGYVPVSPGTLLLVASVLIPLHMYRQLRGAYGVSRLGGIVRMLLMFLAANMALIGFVALLMGLGLVG